MYFSEFETKKLSVHTVNENLVVLKRVLKVVRNTRNSVNTKLTNLVRII